ncbi:MAG: alpha-galactosidase [Rikenellaceae bacterium]|nr:alpha-galactosidase [Rikenellaceae bacterium]
MKPNLKRVLRLVVCLAAAFMLMPNDALAQTTQKIAVPTDVGKWITSTFARGKVPPFSFVYDGKPSTEFIRKWRHSISRQESAQEGVVAYTVTYLDPQSGLQVKCDIKGFEWFGAVEWVLHFANTSKTNTKQIRDVKVTDLTLRSVIDGNFDVLHSAGCSASRADFRPLYSTLSADAPLKMSPQNGRPSDISAYPFFNIITPDKAGVVVGIGWTGTWFADIALTGKQGVNLSSGMKTMDLHLYPGESIRTPLVAMLFWQGDDFMTGNNLFRRFILAHHTRKVDNAYAHAPLCGGFDWGDPAPCNEYSCLTEDFAVALINRHKQFGIVPEVFWLDAGWYEGCGGPDFSGGSWWTNAGNWRVDKTRFPNGLKPLSDAAHKVGAKFMVWFEPERAFEGTQFRKEHPEWLLKVEADKNNYLFDLGNKQANEWLCKYIGDMIEENGIDYYRQDFNMPIARFWKAYDEPGRVGMREIRYVEGLYAYWDYLLERFPGMIIDNCASGGRRIDLETTSRSIPLWRTDYRYGEVNGYQCHTYGLNFFLPLHGTGVYGADNYNFRSSLSSAMVTNWELTAKRGSIGDMQKVLAEFKLLRPYFMEDYYPLTGLGDLTGDDVWLAYQLNRPSDKTGIVVGFRRKDNKQNSIEVKLRGLDPNTNYVVRNENDGKEQTLSGQQLAEGITLSLDKPLDSILLKYSPVE